MMCNMIKRGPPGPDGKQGKDGRPGRDCKCRPHLTSVKFPSLISQTSALPHIDRFVPHPVGFDEKGDDVYAIYEFTGFQIEGCEDPFLAGVYGNGDLRGQGLFKDNGTGNFVPLSDAEVKAAIDAGKASVNGKFSSSYYFGYLADVSKPSCGEFVFYISGESFSPIPFNCDIPDTPEMAENNLYPMKLYATGYPEYDDRVRSYAMAGGFIPCVRVRSTGCLKTKGFVDVDCYGFYLHLIGLGGDSTKTTATASAARIATAFDSFQSSESSGVCGCDSGCGSCECKCWEGRNAQGGDLNITQLPNLPQIAEGDLDLIDGLATRDCRRLEFTPLKKCLRFDLEIFVQSIKSGVVGESGNKPGVVSNPGPLVFLTSDSTEDITEDPLFFHLAKNMVVGGKSGKAEVSNNRTFAENIRCHLLFHPVRPKLCYFAFSFRRGRTGTKRDFPKIYRYGETKDLAVKVNDSEFHCSQVELGAIKCIKGVTRTKCEDGYVNVVDFCESKCCNPIEVFADAKICVYSGCSRGTVTMDFSDLIERFGQFPIDVCGSDGRLMFEVGGDFSKGMCSKFTIHNGSASGPLSLEKEINGLTFNPCPVDGLYTCVFAIPIMLPQSWDCDASPSEVSPSCASESAPCDVVTIVTAPPAAVVPTLAGLPVATVPAGGN